MLDAILTDRGFRVTLAANGQQALAAEHSGDGLPVVMVDALPEEAIAAVTRRCKAFVRKPFRIRPVLSAPCYPPRAGGR